MMGGSETCSVDSVGNQRKKWKKDVIRKNVTALDIRMQGLNPLVFLDVAVGRRAVGDFFFLSHSRCRGRTTEV